MDPRTKAILFILLTLLTGFGAGMLVSGRLVNQRVHQMRKLQTSGGFKGHLQEKLQLQPEQIAPFEEIIDANHQAFQEIHREFFQARKAHLDSLQQQLAPILNQEQLDRLYRILSKPRRPRHPGRPGHRRPDER